MLTPAQIANGIEAQIDRLETLVRHLAEAGNLAAESEADFKAEFAKARLLARAQDPKPTEAHAEDLATVQTADLRKAHLIAQNRLTVGRESIRVATARLDALRTLSASYRSAGG